MKKLLILIIIPLLFSCNNKDLEDRVERLEKIHNISPEPNEYDSDGSIDSSIDV